MDTDNASKDKRRFPRHHVRGGLSVELRVQVSGDRPAVLLTRGMVTDISCGGLKCDIDFAVPIGTDVDVHFPDLTGDALSPDLTFGRVVRTESPGGVPDQVAIAFREPLRRLEVEEIEARRLAPPPPRRGRTAVTRRASWADEPMPFPTFATGSLR